MHGTISVQLHGRLSQLPLSGSAMSCTIACSSTNMARSMFSPTPCLLIPSIFGEGEEKGGKNTTELRAVCFSYFFPFCHYSALYVLNICQDSPPKFIALSSPIFFNTSLGILIPLFLSNFIFFSLFLSSFLYFSPYFPQSLSPLQERKKKKRNEMNCILTIRITAKQCS